MIRVRATQTGHYDLKLRQPGEEFDIKDEQAFSKKWMEKIGGKDERLDGDKWQEVDAATATGKAGSAGTNPSSPGGPKRPGSIVQNEPDHDSGKHSTTTSRR